MRAGPGVILTPDQRIRVFISSTLEELASERVAARRAIQRLRLVPVWYESGARPHPPASAATIQGAAEANVTAPPSLQTRIALDDERVRELRARGADMDWDQAVAYTIAQTTQALNEHGSG